MNVVVLGAGVVGVAAAYCLAKAGHTVTVVERRDGPALETSYGNAGELLGATVAPWVAPDVPMMILRHFGREDAPYLLRLKPDPTIWLWAFGFLRNCTPARVARITAGLQRLGAYSFAETKVIGEAENIDYDRNDRGILHLYRDARAFARAAAEADAETDARRRPQALDMDACTHLEPALDGRGHRYAGALHFTSEATGDSHRFAVGLAAAAERLGATFHYGVSARRLVTNGRAVTGVETDRTTLAAEATVVSLGTQSPILLRPLGLRLPIYPVKGYSVTIPIAEHAGAPSIAIHDHAHKTGITRFGDRLRIAGTAELDGHNTRASEKRMNALAQRLTHMFPDGGDFSRAERWTGLRPMTPDCAPILGRTPYRGLYLDTGHGSLGWTLACGSGRVIADIVSGREPAVDLTGLTMDRF